MTIVLVSLFVLVAVFCLEAIYWLALAALFWAPALVVGATVIQLMSIWRFDSASALGVGIVAAVIARFVTGRIRDHFARQRLA